MLHTSDFSFAAPEIPKDLEITLDPGLVRVSWHAVDNADSYTIVFSQVQGPSQEGLCPTYFHTASLTNNAPYTTVSITVGEDVESSVTDMLRAYTTYEVIVKAFSSVGGIGGPSESRTVLTPQTSVYSQLQFNIIYANVDNA